MENIPGEGLPAAVSVNIIWVLTTSKGVVTAAAIPPENKKNLNYIKESIL